MQYISEDEVDGIQVVEQRLWRVGDRVSGYRRAYADRDSTTRREERINGKGEMRIV